MHRKLLTALATASVMASPILAAADDTLTPATGTLKCGVLSSYVLGEVLLGNTCAHPMAFTMIWDMSSQSPKSVTYRVGGGQTRIITLQSPRGQLTAEVEASEAKGKEALSMLHFQDRPPGKGVVNVSLRAIYFTWGYTPGGTVPVTTSGSWVVSPGRWQPLDTVGSQQKTVILGAEYEPN